MMIDSFFSYFIVGGFMKITVDELLQKLGSIHLIDIRDKESYLEGHIPGAKNIVSSELIYHPNRYLDFDKEYYLYCDVGYISEDVCMRLRMKGYRAISIIGDKVEAAKLYQMAQDINKITQEIDPRDIADKISELFES